MTEDTKPQVFLSYARDEETRVLAASLRTALEAAGVGVWDDTRTLAGSDLRDAMLEAMEKAEAFVLVFSAASAQSRWMQFEIGAAASRAAQSPKIPLIPVLIGNATWSDVPLFFRNRAGIDARTLKPEEVAAKIREAVVRCEAERSAVA